MGGIELSNSTFFSHGSPEATIFLGEIANIGGATAEIYAINPQDGTIQQFSTGLDLSEPTGFAVYHTIGGGDAAGLNADSWAALRIGGAFATEQILRPSGSLKEKAPSFSGEERVNPVAPQVALASSTAANRVSQGQASLPYRILPVQPVDSIFSLGYLLLPLDTACMSPENCSLN